MVSHMTPGTQVLLVMQTVLETEADDVLSLADTAESVNCLDSTAVHTHVPQVVYCMLFVDAKGNYTEVVYRSYVLRGSETWPVRKRE